jgi:hypothetical protein
MIKMSHQWKLPDENTFARLLLPTDEPFGEDFVSEELDSSDPISDSI